MLDWLHQFVIDTVAGYGYAAVFVLMVLESACVPIPSEVTMLFGGALAAPGFAAPGEELSLFWVGIAGTVGNLVGSWIAYWAGAVGGSGNSGGLFASGADTRTVPGAQGGPPASIITAECELPP